MTDASAVQGPRIYNLFPLLAGRVSDWHRHLPRVAAMGFNWIYVNPFHYPGFSGSLYAVKDYYRLHPLFQGDDEVPQERLLGDFVEAAAKQGLAVMMDLVVNHTARDSLLAEAHPEWFARQPDGSLTSPGAVDPDDPSKVTVWGDLAEIDYSYRPEREGLIDYWRALVRYYVGLGFRGFRCDAAYKVPAAVWMPVIEAARSTDGDAVFAAETLGCRLDEVAALASTGFDYLFNSVKWWNFRDDWLLDQYNAFRNIAPSIGFPESHDTERLAEELAAAGVTDPEQVEAGYKLRYRFAAAFASGVMMPIGYEYGFARKLNVVHSRPEHWEEARFDLCAFIADCNREKAELPALNSELPQQRLPTGDAEVVALQRGPDGSGAAALTLANTSLSEARHIELGNLPLDGLAGDSIEPELVGAAAAGNPGLLLQPGAVRSFPLRTRQGPSTASRPPHIESGPAFDLLASCASRPITIQEVYPELDCGRFPVKREVGDELEVWATIFKEGHDRLAAVLKFRVEGEDCWRETAMTLENAGLDRWRGRIRLERNARYQYTIEAWHDAFESWRGELEKKREAGQDVALDLLEGRSLLLEAGERTAAEDGRRLAGFLAEFDQHEDSESRAALLLSSALRDLMARHPDRSGAVQYHHVLAVTVDRIAARFAAWYEMFPRSQGREPGRSATFADCGRRLAEIQGMGFDVVYLVPIHPIGRTHRKGRNNAVTAEPGEPGSPYAIGSPEGGHRAVHSELGTLEDFRRFVAACQERRMEVALDFAIQCSPDHPWIREHPEWFKFRPDGTIKYAENPPKKYQDIVNVNFYGGHQEALWRELRDVVLFWVAQGVKIFRVDNPHTKPIPFWEWLIREVQRDHPEVLFLSEAFTRPPMLHMLAKVGFSQSYTYFTWRNFKGELIEYLTSLTQSGSREYLRPNFFANTPDILPGYLQTGGRPAFQVRLVLAATLSSVYGIYNGFELCENAAIPGKEEYADSEKYEYKVWDWDRPGNIKDYVTLVNRIRRENAALHELDNLRFYFASDDNVLFYGKLTPDRRNMVFCAVNLDPFEAHESTIAFPLHEMGVPEGETYEVEDLLSGAHHLWRGAEQHVRLDPQENPAAIYRVVPWQHVDFREPCF